MFFCLLGLVQIHHADTFVKNALATHTLASLRPLVHITLQIRSGPRLSGFLTSQPRSRLLYLDVRKTLLEVIEEIHVYLINHLWFYAKF